MYITKSLFIFAGMEKLVNSGRKKLPNREKKEPVTIYIKGADLDKIGMERAKEAALKAVLSLL